MELQHFSHIHPLVFNEETGNENEKAAKCSGCGDVLLGPSFSCMACGFYLDKTCAEAPSELAHPFHRNHNLNLLEARPNAHCDFCYKNCENLVYRCSCDFDLHIKCALFLYNTAEKRAGELQIAHTDPLLPTEIHSEELKETECFACWKPLSDSAYLSLDSGFYLHKKCFELPLEINHLCHPQHPLFLQFNSECLPCQICQEIQEKGFVYSCSICNFAIHIACAELPTKLNHLCHRQHPLILQLNPESFDCQICQETKYQGVYCCSNCNFAIHVKCVSPPPSIKGEIHEHPFTLLLRQAPFTCDACGIRGDFCSYNCLTCGLVVHEKCISLPCIIRIGRHHHSLSHTFILGQHEFKTWDCKICPREMNAQHGGYCCKDCNYIVHTNCGKEEFNWYEFYDIEEGDSEQFNKNSAFFVIKETTVGENVIPTEVKHLSHQHNLVLSDDVVKDGKFCDGCMLFISTTFYFCSECNFFLHKSCAESPRKMYFWFYPNQYPYSLNFDSIFFCDVCESWFNSGFAYKHRTSVCLRCALISDTPTCGGDEHRLTCYRKYEDHCVGCGEELSSAFACKNCNFAVEYSCLFLPNVIRHKCDEHLLKLTYGDQNVYSEHNFCDICEEGRNPNLWFYFCAICDSSFHPKCVMGRHPFLKLGLTYRFRDHPHPLNLTQKVYDYPDKCHSCEQHCVDAVLECVENGCDYILHWDCVEDKSSLTLEGPN